MSASKDKPDKRDPILGARYPPETRKAIQDLAKAEGSTTSKVLITIAKYGIPILKMSQNAETSEIINALQQDELISRPDAVCRLLEEGVRSMGKSKKKNAED